MSQVSVIDNNDDNAVLVFQSDKPVFSHAVMPKEGIVEPLLDKLPPLNWQVVLSSEEKQILRSALLRAQTDVPTERPVFTKDGFTLSSTGLENKIKAINEFFKKDTYTLSLTGPRSIKLDTRCNFNLEDGLALVDIYYILDLSESELNEILKALE